MSNRAILQFFLLRSLHLTPGTSAMPPLPLLCATGPRFSNAFAEPTFPRNRFRFGSRFEKPPTLAALHPTTFPKADLPDTPCPHFFLFFSSLALASFWIPPSAAPIITPVTLVSWQTRCGIEGSTHVLSQKTKKPSFGTDVGNSFAISILTFLLLSAWPGCSVKDLGGGKVNVRTVSCPIHALTAFLVHSTSSSTKPSV